jgi:CheY-like chemotaxis protein
MGRFRRFREALCYGTSDATDLGHGPAEGGERLPMTLRILIVEDEAIIGLLLGDLLADMGHDVCAIASTAIEAVAAAAAHRPELMIVDVNLGGENGIAAVDAIQAQWPTPCIFVSGDDHVLSILAARGQVLAKPYQPRQIALAITHALVAGGIA